MKRICCISDIHGHLPKVPECDLLILAGDYCADHRNYFWYGRHFGTWLGEIRDRGTDIIGVAGNHDYIFEKKPDFKLSQWTYLQDAGTTWNGLKVWGSPWQPRFFDWAFNLDEPGLEEKWALIPDGTDILILHGPPFGYGDLTNRHERTGSPSLTKRIEDVKPKLVVCGHIHIGYGTYRMGETIIVNAAHCDESYRPVNPPIVVELAVREILSK
jgi:Icc-related predicted phosphoesterase